MDEEFASFEQELEQFLDFDSPEVGDLRKGTIVSISSQGMIVALSNLKRDGIVPNSDLNKLDDAERSRLEVNDEVSVKVVSTSDPDSLIVSVYQAMVVEDWARAEELKESAEMVEVEIGGYNKGGLIAPFGRLRGFIPLSQVGGFSRNLNDRERQRRMAKMRGEKIPVKVIEVDRERRRLVFSQREGMREFEAARREEFMKSIEVGSVLKGRVRSIRDFGVFVDLGEADGLVHVSELAWHRVKHPRDIVKVGDEIEVQVLRVDPEQQRISLSRKPLLENPWDVIEERYTEGQLVEGTIVRIADYGAFIELEPGVEGLLHITQLSRSNVENVREIVQEDEKHLLRVLTVDKERQRVRLSLKAVSANEQIEWMTTQSEAAAEAEAAAAAEAEAAESAEKAETTAESSDEATAATVEAEPAAEEQASTETDAPAEEASAEAEAPAEATEVAAETSDVAESAVEEAEPAAEELEVEVVEAVEATAPTVEAAKPIVDVEAAVEEQTVEAEAATEEVAEVEVEEVAAADESSDSDTEDAPVATEASVADVAEAEAEESTAEEPATEEVAIEETAVPEETEEA